MLKQKKVEQKQFFSKTLPMPKYEYQKPTNGSFSYRYDEKSEENADKKTKIDLKIQNLKFV